MSAYAAARIASMSMQIFEIPPWFLIVCCQLSQNWCKISDTVQPTQMMGQIQHSWLRAHLLHVKDSWLWCHHQLISV